jgi:Zn-dependent protease with chaperone function
MIIVLLFLVLLFAAVVIIGPLVGVSFWPLVGYAWMAMVASYFALVAVSEWHKKRKTDADYKSLAYMETHAYEALTRTCRCVDCGKSCTVNGTGGDDEGA